MRFNPLISIHALLAESDRHRSVNQHQGRQFLSTLSLRRATHYDNYNLHCVEISIHALLAESDTWARGSRITYVISIHALLAESDSINREGGNGVIFISIHALLAESDARKTSIAGRITSFLSTLSLRRATIIKISLLFRPLNFYPRSPCGERLNGIGLIVHIGGFLSTLSLRRATTIHNAEIDKLNDFYPRSPCGERPSSTVIVIFFKNFYPRSPCGERHTWARGSRVTYVISIHALLAESDSKSAQNSGALLRI